jgi:hypothetical protein
MRTGANDITPEGFFHNNGNRIEVGAVMRMQDMYLIRRCQYHSVHRPRGGRLLSMVLDSLTSTPLLYLRFNTQLSDLTDTFSNMAGTLLQFLLV